MCPIHRALRDEWVLYLLLTLAFLLPTTAPAQYQTPNAPLLGAAWYPEQFPESTWDRDLTLMEQAHMNVVRVGEFAWSTLEPSEGHYNLDWLDRAITLAAAHHIKVVLGTPTDAPPAWLTKKYPETLGMNADGRLREHGNRRQFNYANPHYRQLCAQIVRVMAQRFGHNPNILGWQIGNEYTDESFDPATRTQFQQFLKARYKTLDSLNQHWSTAYWSQTYTDWSQIPMEATSGNPGLLLEHKHFVTATWVSFQQNQIDVLRPLILKSQFITTNIGGLAWSDNWDHYAITAPLDLASWDEYVGQGHLDAPKEAMLNDFVRGWKRQNFWVMETQPGSVNWAGINNTLSPGETRALAWQAIGHGADAILYWQWRDAPNGQEQYHGALLGQDGTPNPIYKEIQQLGADLDQTRAALTGTQPGLPSAPFIASSAMSGVSAAGSGGNQIALLYDYDYRWAIDFQPHTKNYDQQQILLRFYEPLEQLATAAHQQVDIIDPTQPSSRYSKPDLKNLYQGHTADSARAISELAQYKLLVAPSLNVIDDVLAAELLDWVKAGGHLILGPRSGMKDDVDALRPERQPGPLAEALGAKVEQYYALDHPVDLVGPDEFAHVGKGDIWAEALTKTSPQTETDLVYSDPGGWLDVKPAAVSRPYGKGGIAYLGTIPGTTYLQQMFGITSGIDLPPQVDLEILARGPVTIYINHKPEPHTLQFRQPQRNLLTPNAALITTLTLQPQGVAVLIASP